jgi:hypothetical protein
MTVVPGLQNHLESDWSSYNEPAVGQLQLMHQALWKQQHSLVREKMYSEILQT